jgi:hypothetical protein
MYCVCVTSILDFLYVLFCVIFPGLEYQPQQAVSLELCCKKTARKGYKISGGPNCRAVLPKNGKKAINSFGRSETAASRGGYITAAYSEFRGDAGRNGGGGHHHRGVARRHPKPARAQLGFVRVHSRRPRTRHSMSSRVVHARFRRQRRLHVESFTCSPGRRRRRRRRPPRGARAICVHQAVEAVGCGAAGGGGPRARACLMLLATSYDVIYLKNRGFNFHWMTWRAMGQADIARHVKGCHSTQETWVQNACQ